MKLRTSLDQLDRFNDHRSAEILMGKHSPIRLMREDEVPAYIEAVLKTGCDICAVGHDAYVIGDFDLPIEKYRFVAPKLKAINEQFGDRDFVKLKIVRHLRALGRYVDPNDDQQDT